MYIETNMRISMYFMYKCIWIRAVLQESPCFGCAAVSAFHCLCTSVYNRRHGFCFSDKYLEAVTTLREETRCHDYCNKADTSPRKTLNNNRKTHSSSGTGSCKELILDWSNLLGRMWNHRQTGHGLSQRCCGILKELTQNYLACWECQSEPSPESGYKVMQWRLGSMVLDMLTS